MINPKDLPVYKEREKILRELEKNQVIIVESPTGSGKTTQLPIILHEAGYARNGVIGVTQPRRIATLSVSDYIAKQFNTSIPGLVGYKMRFNDKTVLETELKIMTDGILLQELKADFMLRKYSTIIVDEAHERSLNIDFILGLLKEVLAQRPEFRLIISSATINPTIFSEYFDGCPIIHIDAKIYPIKTIYAPPEIADDYQKLLDKITELVRNRMRSEVEGDVLIFLPGERMIKDCMMSLINESFSKDLIIIPLYGRLPKEDQERVFLETPEGKTKVVVSTNIAETSITIDNITTVIDSGLAKMNFYNPNTFTSSLIQVPVSRASSNQRKGRAGRTAAGYCFRLFSKEEFDARDMFTSEEIRRTDLSEVVLRMAELGIQNFQSFDFITSPGAQGIASAVNTLKLLDALDHENRLTRIGRLMTEFPLLPRHSRMIVEAVYAYPQVIHESVIAAAFLSSHSPFSFPVGQETESRSKQKTFADPYGDFVSYLKLFKIYTAKVPGRERERYCREFFLDYQTMEEIVNIVMQLEEIVAAQEIPVTEGGSVHDYLCAVSKGLIQFVCVRAGRGVYRSLTAEKIYIHPGSFMFKEAPYYIVAGEIVKTTRMFARSVSVLRREWVHEIYPDFIPQMSPEGAREPQAKGKKAGAPRGRKPVEAQAGLSKDHEKIVSQAGESRIILYNDIFSIIPYKGSKKLIVIPFEKLASLHENYTKDPKSVRNYRIKITYRSYDLHTGDRLASIMKIVPYLKPEKAILNAPPKGNFVAAEQLSELSDSLVQVFAFCKIAKKQKILGFLALDTNNKGTYWFKAVKNFHTAVDTTLYSAQALMDEISHMTDPPADAVERVNRLYRQVTTLFENY